MNASLEAPPQIQTDRELANMKTDGSRRCNLKHGEKKNEDLRMTSLTEMGDTIKCTNICTKGEPKGEERKKGDELF